VSESDKVQTIATCIHEIAETFAVLESNLPRRVDGFALSQKSKMPWKVLLYREALIWRMVELSRRAFESFASDQLVCGIVLTRAVLEVSAALWFLCAKVEAVVDSKIVGDVDEYLVKLAMGTATGWPENSAPGAVAMPRPVKVGKMLEQTEEDIEGFSHQYGVLSEYAHPNWAGTVLLYSDTDRQTAVTVFGRYMRNAEPTKAIGAVNLNAALKMFQSRYNRMSDLLPSFIDLCEAYATEHGS
jgi:hypothetical protein